jgi:MFS family permease
MEEIDLKKIWKTAGEDELKIKKYSLNEIQLYRTKKSKQASRTSRTGILFDIFYKIAVSAGYIYLLIILDYQFPWQIIITCLLAALLILAAAELGFLKKLNLISESDSVIENLQKKYDFLKTTYKKFIFFSALSNPFFVTGGFFLYFYFKYGEIKMAAPFEDPVLYIFIVISFLISLAGQWPFYKIQLKDLKESIEDLDDDKIAGLKIEEAIRRRKKIIVISSILLLTGVLFLLILIFG